MFARTISSIGILVIAFGSIVPSASAWRLSRTGYYTNASKPRPVVSQRGRARPSLRKVVSSMRSSISSSTSSVSSVSGTRDPDSDAVLRGRIVMLGTVSPVLGALNVFSSAEPLIVTRFTVVLGSGYVRRSSAAL